MKKKDYDTGVDEATPIEESFSDKITRETKEMREILKRESLAILKAAERYSTSEEMEDFKNNK